MSASAAVPSVRRTSTFSSVVWYATLIILPLATAAFLFSVRQTRVHQLAQRNLADYGTAPEFRLTNQNGAPFGSIELKGKIWIADFVFTSCPGPCPIISSRMAEMQRPLENSDVHLVSFTVDPKTDTPAVLLDYAHRLHAREGRWDFLTGDTDTIYGLIEKGFKLAVSDGAQEMGTPVHSTRAALIDRHGTIRGYYDIIAPDGVTKLLADTNHLLREEKE